MSIRKSKFSTRIAVFEERICKFSSAQLYGFVSNFKIVNILRHLLEVLLDCWAVDPRYCLAILVANLGLIIIITINIISSWSIIIKSVMMLPSPAPFSTSSLPSHHTCQYCHQQPGSRTGPRPAHFHGSSPLSYDHWSLIMHVTKTLRELENRDLLKSNILTAFEGSDCAALGEA